MKKISLICAMMLMAWATAGAVATNYSDGSSVSLSDAEYIDGDINHDGKVDVKDMNRLINIILGIDEPGQDTAESFTVDGVTFKMIKVNHGTFTMGASPEQQFPLDEEKPAHSVTLTRDYFIGETEVTQELWTAVMGNNPSYFEGDNLPVEQVSWNDCQEFISKLNSITGRTFRLPTEAEWEFAARGGNKSNGYQYSGSDNIDEVAWYFDNSVFNIHPVATKKPNELGIYDMSGSVWEWCQDWYDSYPDSAVTDPQGPDSGSYRVYRGASWDNVAGNCRTACRAYWIDSYFANNQGLRLALPKSLEGDINNDGRVDIKDLNRLINIILGIDDPALYE